MSRVLAEVAGKIVTLLGYDGTDFRNIHVDAAGNLHVGVVGSVLPVGAATSANQEANTDLLELIALLRNALLSVATDSLRVWIVPDAITPRVYNVTMTNADEEYSQALPLDTWKFAIKCRGVYDVKLAFVEDGSGATYITIPAGQTYWDDGIRATATTLYFQCATAGQIAEIVAWA